MTQAPLSKEAYTLQPDNSGSSSLVVWKHGRELEELRQECEEKEQEKRKLMILLKNRAFFSFSCSRKFRICSKYKELYRRKNNCFCSLQM